MSLVGCSSAEPGPAPTDPVVYAASAETEAATGVATWGYGTDASGTTTFRGYDALNAEVVELRHVFQITGPYTRRFGLKMHGPEGSGDVHIEFESVWNEAAKSSQYVARVVENTVPRGELTQQLLRRVAPDAKGIPAEAASSTLAPNAPLLDGNGDPITCCCQLQNNGAALSGAVVSECAQVDDAPPATSSLAGSRLGPLDLVVGADGQPLVASPWTPPYNIVDNHCHDAAAANVSSTNGYIGCHPTSSTTTFSGHTINWAPDPTKQREGAYCAYEPQKGGVSLVDGAACCWEGDTGSNGAPLFNNSASQDCVTKMCLGQAYRDGNAPPHAFPPGQTPLVAKDCSASSPDAASCQSCCQSEGDFIASKFSDADYASQVEDYRRRCSTSCSDGGLTGSPPGSAGLTPRTFVPTLRPLDVGVAPAARASRCLAGGLASNRALAEAMAVCGIKP